MSCPQCGRWHVRWIPCGVQVAQRWFAQLPPSPTDRADEAEQNALIVDTHRHEWWLAIRDSAERGMAMCRLDAELEQLP